MSEPMDLIYKDPKYPSSKVVNGYPKRQIL